MEGEARARRASWFNPRLRIYKIKERPKSWVYGNYRKTVQEENNTAAGVQSRKPKPPTPPVRSPLTRLQSDPSMGRSVRNMTDQNSKEDLHDKILNEISARDDSGTQSANQEMNTASRDKDFVLEI